MHLKKIILLLILSINVIYAQNDLSVHNLHKQEFGSEEKLESKFDISGKDIIPLNLSKANKLNSVVFGYLPYWEYNNGAHQHLRYDLLSHVACFDFFVSPNGDVSLPSAWPWTDVINAAHQNGTKIILTAVNFNKEDIRAIITSQNAKDNFFNQIKTIMTTYSMDGVNIDFESLYNDDKGNRIVNFMFDLTTFIHTELPGKEVSFAGPAVNWGDHWDLEGLAASCDYVFIMGYAFAGSWSSVTAPNSPLVGGTNNITNTVKIEYGQVTNSNPEKIILGIPYYGHHWITTGPSAGASTTEFIRSTRFSTSKPQSQVYGNIWASSKTPWYRWNDGQWHQIWHDDDSSLGLKYDLAIEENLLGVGMWALGYDKGRDELWNLIDWKFGEGHIPVPEKPEYFSVLTHSDSTLLLLIDKPMRTTGIKIYQSRDGIEFTDSFTVAENNYIVKGLEGDSVYYFKAKAINESGESAETEVLAGSPAGDGKRILVVNGFDRTSGTNNNFDYIRMYTDPITKYGNGFSSASNEAVFKGIIPIENADIVFWMLGDESTADETLNIFEREKVKGYLKQGGMLFISGSEVGWDIGRQGFSSSDEISFYENYLKAHFITDAPNNSSGTYYSASGISGTIFDNLVYINFDDGTHGTFNVDYPDAIEAVNGGTNILQFENVAVNNGAAAVAYEGMFPEGSMAGKLVYMSIPFESIYPQTKRNELLSRVLDYFSLPVSVEEKDYTPNEFYLMQNYPNPFNPSTTIQFNSPSAGRAKLHIYNSIGQLVYKRDVEKVNSGLNKIIWNTEVSGNGSLSSGVYIYNLNLITEEGKNYSQSQKMILLK